MLARGCDMSVDDGQRRKPKAVKEDIELSDYQLIYRTNLWTKTNPNTLES
jgi:hypothetical protein